MDNVVDSQSKAVYLKISEDLPFLNTKPTLHQDATSAKDVHASQLHLSKFCLTSHEIFCRSSPQEPHVAMEKVLAKGVVGSGSLLRLQQPHESGTVRWMQLHLYQVLLRQCQI